jgi:hypothetical protein
MEGWWDGNFRPTPAIQPKSLNGNYAAETGHLLNVIWPVFSVVCIRSVDN